VGSPKKKAAVDKSMYLSVNLPAASKETQKPASNNPENINAGGVISTYK
jgi:hypothetical protein